MTVACRIGRLACKVEMLPPEKEALTTTTASPTASLGCAPCSGIPAEVSKTARAVLLSDSYGVRGSILRV